MLSDFKRVLRHSTIYGIGNIISKMGIFLMTPVYTRYLTPADYGSLELFYVTATVLRIFLAMAIAHATLRFFFEYDEVLERKRIVSTALLSSGLLGIFCAAVFFQFSEPLSNLIFQTPRYADLFKLVVVTFLLDLSMEISLAYIRAKEYSLFYVAVCSGQLLVRIAINLYMLIAIQKGIRGILIGDLISTFLAWLVLTSVTLRFSGFNFHFPKLKEMLLYSYPLALGSFSGIIIRSSDRYFLNAFSSLGTIGLYALAYRFGTSLQALYTEPFTKSYGPFRFSIMKKDNAEKFYSRILTYYLFGFLFLGLGLSALAKEVIRLMASSPFWEAYTIIPLIVLASAGEGCYYIFQIGIYIEKKTKYVPMILFSSALINLGFNWLLVPRFNMYGAALTLLVTNLVTCVMAYIVSQKFYPVRYEFGRISKLLIIACCLFAVSLLIHTTVLWTDVILKTALVFSFPFLLFFFNFYHQDEVNAIRDGWDYLRLRLMGRPQSEDV